MDARELDDLLAPASWSKDRCFVAQALEDVEDEGNRAKVAAACGDRRVSSDRIAQAFSQLIGRRPARETIAKHQRGVCKCAQ